MWTINLTEYVFISGALLIINAWGRICPSYYNLNPRFDDLSDAIFCLTDRILDALRYFRLYKFAMRTGTDPVMTFLAFYLCGKFDWYTTAVRGWFVSYNPESGEVIGLQAESIPASRLVRSSD